MNNTVTSIGAGNRYDTHYYMQRALIEVHGQIISVDKDKKLFKTGLSRPPMKSPTNSKSGSNGKAGSRKQARVGSSPARQRFWRCLAVSYLPTSIGEHDRLLLH
jgi:hypothetical protein